jgi:hypothetical protein
LTAAALVRDLLLGSRIEEAAARAGVPLRRVTSVDDLPPANDVDVAFVAWDERDADWGPRLAEWRDSATPAPRLVLFGPHTDVGAHQEAREHEIGPVWARSKLVVELDQVLGAPVSSVEP